MADPFLDQMQAMLSAQSQADAATRRTSTNRAFVDYGAIPDFSQFNITSPFLNDIDPATAGLAAQNTASGLSFLGRQNKMHKDATRRIPDMLASRGILQSGELGHQLGEENLRYQQANYDASKQLIDFLSGAQSVFQQGEFQRGMTLLEAQQQAAIRAQELQFRQQEMAQQQSQFQQQMAMSQSGGGGDGGGGGGFDFGDMFGGGEEVSGPPGPNPQELRIMAGATQKAARHRSPQELQLFQQYTDWRNQNPGWWQ